MLMHDLVTIHTYARDAASQSVQEVRMPDSWLDVLQTGGKHLPDKAKGAWHTLTCCKEVSEAMTPLWNKQALASVRIIFVAQV
jgi:hypothetical protein